MRETRNLLINGKRVSVSNLDKVLYPAARFTKAQVIDFYIRISSLLLPHLKNRPLTLKRYPEGVDREFFYEKRCPSHRPPWVKTASVWSKHNKANIDFCLINDVSSLVWAANLADIEMHTSLARCMNIERPTMLMFDLDPGPPATLVQCAQVALWLREKFDSLKLKAFPKTSGGKGLHLVVPLNGPVSYKETKPFAHALAKLLAREHPENVVSEMEKRLRKGKVFVDWSQNDRHKTTVCVYSLRAREQPTVSTPLDWDEVAHVWKRKNPTPIHFKSDALLKRVEKRGDLFEPVLKLKQKLPRIDRVSETQ